MTFASTISALEVSSIQSDSDFKDLILLCRQEARFVKHFGDKYMAESEPKDLSLLLRWNEICDKVNEISDDCRRRLKTIQEKILRDAHASQKI